MSDYGEEGFGDNIEFTASAIGDYTIYFNTTGTDTEFLKYPTNVPDTIGVRKFIIRTDKSTDLVGMDNRTFTDPVQITADKAHTETRNVPTISRMIIRTNATDTMIKVRWF